MPEAASLGDPQGPARLPKQLSVSDPTALRALSHPTRLLVLNELALLGRANVAMVAGRVGEPANSVSYHLSILAKHALIVPATPPHGATRRERWWRLGSEEGIEFGTEDESLAVPLRAAVATWRGQLAADLVERKERSSAAAEARDLPSKQTSFGVWLTPDAAREAFERVTQAMAPLRDAFLSQRTAGLSDPPAEGMDYYRVDVVMFADVVRSPEPSEQRGDGIDEAGPQG